MRSLRSFCLIIVVAACSSNGGTPDATAIADIDGAASVDPDGAPTGAADAAATDAPVMEIDAGRPDPDDGGAVDPSDGGGLPIDGDAGPIGATCVMLCNKIFSCFAIPPDPECAIECSADLSDCSDEQLAEVIACFEMPCEDFETELEACVAPIGCLEGGGGEEPFCGDTVCGDGEDCGRCPEDCGECVCGDGRCSLGECATCADDCPGGCSCPHDMCVPGEALDPGCGDCEKTVCMEDPFCCEEEWDPACISEAESLCDKECPAICGDFLCDDGETCESCESDCCFVDPPPPPA